MPSLYLRFDIERSCFFQFCFTSLLVYRGCMMASGRVWKELVLASSRCYPDTRPDGLMKTTQIHREDSTRTGRNLNQIRPEYISMTSPMHSARFLKFYPTEFCSRLSFVCCHGCHVVCLYRPQRL